MIRRPPRSTQSRSSAASDVYKRQASSTTGRRDVLRQSALGAQAFSWGGDLALMGGSERAFLGGVGSFFAAHTAYITGFASAGSFSSASASDSAGPNSAGLKTAAVM